MPASAPSAAHASPAHCHRSRTGSGGKHATCLLLLAVTLLLGLGPRATAAPTALEPGDVLIATTDGLFHLRAGDVTWLISSFTLGLTETEAVEWERGTDSVLIASGDKLLRVEIHSLSPISLTVTDLSPAVTTASGAPARFIDMDANPGTGELFLLEGVDNRVLRYAPPFAPGMTHDLSMETVGGARAVAVASRRYPPGIVAGTNQAVTWHGLAGGQQPVSLNGHNGLDVDPQLPFGVFQTSTNSNRVELSGFGSTGLVLNLNVGEFGCLAYALGPTDIEWDSGSQYAYVLAGGGVNPLCNPAYANPNHVVRFPRIAGGPNKTEILTQPFNSEITGTAGDLAVVNPAYGFAVSYGAPSNNTPAQVVLDHGGGLGELPTTGNADFKIQLTGGLPFAPLHLIVGLSATEVPFLGSTLWASPDALLGLPPLDAAGALALLAPIPADPILVGLDLYLQTVHGALGGPWSTSNGLMLNLDV